MSRYHRFNLNEGEEDDPSVDQYLNARSRHQQSANDYLTTPAGTTTRDDDSINFQHPEPAYNTYNRSHDHLADYYDDHPSAIFQGSSTNLAAAPAAPHFSPLPTPQNPFDNAFSGQQTAYGSQYDPNHNYELNEFHDYNYGANNAKFQEAFVPHVYDADDDDEREFDQRIQYDQFEGDYYDLNTVVLPPTPAPALEVAPSEAPRTVVTTSAYEVPQSPFGDENIEYGEPEHQEEPRQPPPLVYISGINGHLVLDCPVAETLLQKYQDFNRNVPGYGLSREFSFMRYTAVTCGPSNFERDNYILRQIHYDPEPRKTELMVVITMYNEDDILLARTLKGVFKNIKHLESRTRSSTWGKNSWKKVVVCVVSDGRSKINERAQALLAALGVYQAGLAKSTVDDKPVKAHIYEYTTRVGILSVDDTVKLTTEKIVPVQLLFCLKEKNAKKINSHRWCFEAIGKTLDPNVVVLLDAGTQPSGTALYHLWKEFARDPKVAGACGEIKTSLKARQVVTNPLVMAQNFEYKISNILDKPTESVFGFISVLPGAFSAYRFTALQNDINGKGPLEKYFKGEFLHDAGDLDPKDDEYELKHRMLQNEAGIFTSNMYLAEDRILCYELVAKKNCSWLLRYCKSAVAETDVPDRLAEFVLQRRRWLNGSFFAAIYSLAHFPKLWHSSHSIGRKFWLHVQFVYQMVSLVVSWFSIGSYFLVFRILTTSLGDSDLNFAPGEVLSVIFLWLYLASIVTTFVLSFGNKPKGTEKFYLVIVIFFAILMAYMIFAAIFMAVHSIQSIYESQTKITVKLFFQNSEFRDLVVATSSTYALYFLLSFLYFEPWHMFTSFIQYILLSPSYVNVLNIYAFCNIDDVSWGTKGDTGAKDLGAAVKKEDGTFDVAIPVHTEEINQCYLDELAKIRSPIEHNEKFEPSHEDYYAFIRSMTVLVWMFSNFVVIALVLMTGGFNQFVEATDLDTQKTNRAKIFLTVILWTVAFMALFRFVGCLLYLIQRFVRHFKSTTQTPPRKA